MEVLLFHGMTGSPKELEPLVEALRRAGHSVTVPVLPGHESSIAELKVVRTSEFMRCAEDALCMLSAKTRGSVVVGGISFGSILALSLATFFPALVSKVILLSPPLFLRSYPSHLLSVVLSYLPEPLLDLLPCVKKSSRSKEVFAFPRESFPEHSVGAVARLFKVRRKLLRNLGSLRAPTLILQDPHDHHLSPRGAVLLKGLLHHAKVTLHWLPGGQHELTIGHSYQEVLRLVDEFLKDRAHA